MSKSRVLRNIRFFIPILIKVSPFTVFSMIFIALLQSVNSFLWVILPKLLIDELMGNKDIKIIIVIVFAFALIRFLVNVGIRFLSFINSYQARRAEFYIDKMLNDKVMAIDYFHIEDPLFSDKLARANKGMNQHSSGIYSFINSVQNILRAAISVLGVIGIIFYSKEYLVILVSIVGVLLNTYTFTKIQKFDKEFNDSIVRHNRRLYYYNKNITNFRMQKELRLYNAKKMILDVCNKENNEAFTKYRKHSNKVAFFNFIDTTFMYFVTRFLTIALLTYSVYQNHDFTSIATLTMLVTAIYTLDNESANLIYSTKDYLQACKYQEDFIDLMEMKTIFKEGKLPIEAIESIEFQNVSFKYPRTDTYILRDLNFKIGNKEKVSLVGLNGSGKTTLIKLLCRFFPVDEGEILVNGVNIDFYDYNDYMKLMAIVFQDFKIISFSIKSNIAIVEDDQDKLFDALKRAQVLDKVLSLPNKENTYINKWFDKTGVEFSGGEMQKFAIARCLYKDSDLVILDEPTSALDPLAEAEIYYRFNEIVGKKLCIFISHRLSSCIFSDRILVLDGARVVEEGNHQSLIKNKSGLYCTMFNSQAEYYK